MNCEEIRTTISRPNSFSEATNALIAAVRNHVKDCEACQEWLNDLPRHPVSLETVIFVARRTAEALNDPECS